MTSTGPGTPAPAVLRAAAILDVIAANPDAFPRVAEIARATGIPHSSVTNILAALVETGMARRTGSGFSIGPSVVEFASVFLRSDDSVQRFLDFVPTLETLAGETAQLGTLDAGDVLFIARHDGTQPIALTSGVGKRLPASSTAIGKAMLAQLEPAALAATLSDPLPRLTDRSHATMAALSDDLAAIRERGYAIDDEEAAPNVTCLAVAVKSPRDGPQYAVSTTLFKNRLTPDLRDGLVADLTSVTAYLEK
ncbi:MAG: IclR family transcriptional regulator [Acidimicrobiia bacterium]|jgi:DNA-binding IclR family transcriptional regulator